MTRSLSYFATAILTLSMSAWLCHSSDWPNFKKTNHSVEPIVIKPLESSQTTVKITGHPTEPVYIYQQTSDGPKKRLTLEKGTTQEISFPPGQFYAESGTNKIGIPVLPSKNSKVTEIVFPECWPKEQQDWSWIPPGPALLGDRLGIGAEDERPHRIQDFSGFWMEKTEVTNRQYADFLNESKSFDPMWIDLRSRKCGVKRNKDGSFQATLPDHPVVMVSFFGAQAYCKFLTKKSGIVHRLPTEWEWEKAAKGLSDQIYSYGNIYFQNQANQESGKLVEVGKFQPNEYGLFDMTGNVFEWTNSRFDPKLATRDLNQSLRGGSFVLDGMYLRNSFRMKQSPEVMTDDFGFRVLRESTGETKKNVPEK